MLAGSSYEHGSLSTVSMECGVFLDKVNVCQLLKEVHVYRIRSCVRLFSFY